MADPTITTLAYNVAFKCHSCTRCCRDWQVPIRRDELPKIAGLITEKFGKDRLDDFITPVANDPQVTARFQLKPNRACVFLNETTNLCDFQTEFGEKNLPSVCKTYPRQLIEFDQPDAYSYDYNLSATCPTALGLLTSESLCRVVTDENYNTQIYNALRRSAAAKALTLTNRKISHDAFRLLKNAMSERFNDVELEVDETLIFLANLLTEVLNEPGEDEFTAAEMEIFLAKANARDKALIRADAAAIPPSPRMHLISVGAWLKLRSSFPVQEERMRELIQKYARDTYNGEEVLEFQTAYRDRVAPALKSHHWIMRNYLAGKIFFNPDTIDFDYVPLGFVSAYAAQSLIKTLLVETAHAKPDAPLSQSDVLDAVQTVEYSFVHMRKMEENFGRMLAENRVPPKEFAGIIKI